MDHSLIDERTGKEFEVSQEVLECLNMRDFMLPAIEDAMGDVETQGLLGLQDDSPEYQRILAQEGFNNQTGVYAVMGNQHVGAMLCAGFDMMEFDDE